MKNVDSEAAAIATILTLLLIVVCLAIRALVGSLAFALVGALAFWRVVYLWVADT